MAWHASTEEKESRVHMRTASLKDSPRLMRCRWHYSCDVHATEPRPSVPIPLQLKIFPFYILFPLKYSIHRHNTDPVSKRLPWMWSFQIDASANSMNFSHWPSFFILLVETRKISRKGNSKEEKLLFKIYFVKRNKRKSININRIHTLQQIFY